MKYWIMVMLIVSQSGCQIWGDDDHQESPEEALQEQSEEQEGAAVAEADQQAEQEQEEDQEGEDGEQAWVEGLRAQVKDMRLDQSRLWSKVEELEAVVRSIKEQNHLLKKGLMTGIVPMGLSGVSNNQRDPLMMDDDGDDDMHEVTMKPEKTLLRDRELYAQTYAKARAFFQKADYGKAYLEFSALRSEYAAEIHHDEPLYWIGRCWNLLKDYQKAKESFEAYLEQQSNTPWVASAHVELAKVDMKMGSQTLAIQRLKTMLQKYPYEASADEARALLGSMDKKL